MLQRPQLQCLEAAKDEERRQRRDRSAGEIAQPVHAYFPDRVGAADHGAREQFAVTAEVFRRRVNDEICAPFERPLQDRRRKCVVDDGQSAGGPGEARDRCGVDHPQVGVGGGLEEDEPRPTNCLAESFEILEVEELRFNAEFLQAARQQREGASV